MTATIDTQIQPADPFVLCVGEPGADEPTSLSFEDTSVGIQWAPTGKLEDFLKANDPARVSTAMLFASDVKSAQASAQLFRDRQSYSKTRLFLILTGSEAAERVEEEDQDIEGVFDRDSLGTDGLRELIRNGIRSHRALGNNPLMTQYFLDSSYDDVMTWFEKTRWEWSDLPDFKEIDKSLVTDESLELIKQMAIGEFGTLPGAHNFLREWGNEYSFSPWALTWGAEESRHFLVLCRYLRANGKDMLSKHALYKREPYPQGDSPTATLMINIIAECRATEVYAGLAEVLEEPVIKKIFRLLSRDESRHAAAFYQYCKELCDHDAVEHLVPCVEMAYVWLADRTRGGFSKHPAAFFYTHSPSQAGFRVVEDFLRPERGDVVERANRRVFGMLQKLTGCDQIESTQDIKNWLSEQYV